MEPITVLIVDDHTVAREGLRAMLETDPQVRVVAEAADGLEALERVAELRPAVVLMDVRMPRMDGLEATRRMKAEHPTTAVIIMTSYDDDALVVAAVRAAAAGYLLKDVSRDLLRHTIGAVASGGVLIKDSLLRKAISGFFHTAQSPEADLPDLRAAAVEDLTEREREVLRLLAEGLTNKEIGDTLALAEVTVKKHVQSIIAKLGASGRTHAAITGMRMGLLK
ncbi:MAG: response regulator transcription factor [Chloroflexi bacterium]|nr:response regulator transcription factor [Chloroflexota bacterium]